VAQADGLRFAYILLAVISLCATTALDAVPARFRQVRMVFDFPAPYRRSEALSGYCGRQLLRMCLRINYFVMDLSRTTEFRQIRRVIPRYGTSAGGYVFLACALKSGRQLTVGAGSAFRHRQDARKNQR
jgi:hypothetical protein